jgi:hypothetical protein
MIVFGQAGMGRCFTLLAWCPDRVRRIAKCVPFLPRFAPYAAFPRASVCSVACVSAGIAALSWEDAPFRSTPPLLGSEKSTDSTFTLDHVPAFGLLG